MVQAAKSGAGTFLGAVIGAVLENRDTIKKTAAAITVVLLLPLLFLTMLPGLVFGDLSENSGALNSGTLIHENLRAANQAIIEVLRECHDEVLQKIQQEASKVPAKHTSMIPAAAHRC